MIGFGTLDWAVLGVFFAFLAGIVVWVLRQKEETTQDYFLAGRDAGTVETQPFAAGITGKKQDQGDQRNDAGHLPGQLWQGAEACFLTVA